jgi:hypothetical protein
LVIFERAGGVRRALRRPGVVARVDGVLACCLSWAAGYILSGVSCRSFDVRYVLANTAFCNISERC